MLNFSKCGLAALFAATAMPAFAADIYEPVPEPTPPQVVYQEVSTGGWYLRGDLDYHWSKFRGGDYITYGGAVPIPGTNSFDFGKLKGAMSLGAGVGYQVNNYFRTDLTADYWFKSDFNGQTSDLVTVSTDTSSYSALLLLANAYVDLGTYNRITPYVGAGIGGARVKWDDLRNQFPGVDDRHKGVASWRFAYALMAGASYCLTKNLHFDAGYRFTRIDGGRMFEYADSSAGGPGAGPGFDRGFNVHEVRGGLRYQFGAGKAECGEPEMVAYEPPAVEPVYK
ncbi:porin family protein [Pseudaminobacter arsenicus]|uniref:Porin family protein n=1 Tax=Borborobacter arsenicus TaxID=1851146 RepID=A0A432V0R8_9HYPH|nr:outer membrane protein [Pseudaminobacter arsenicus]RUM95685.1 porin family protein [Pseudaminobacter arsenicus]